MTAQRATVSFKMPLELLGRLDEYAATQRTTRSEAVFALLGDALSATGGALVRAPAAIRATEPDPLLFLFEGNTIAGTMTLAEFSASGLPLAKLSPGDQSEYGDRIAQIRMARV